MNLRRRSFLFACFACPLVILGSCAQTASPPLRVGMNVWPGYEGFYLANNLGYYDDRLIQLVDYPSATEVSRAMRNGNLDVAALTLDEALSLAETNPDTRVVLIIDVSAGADVIIAKPEIKTLAELKGRRVGAEANALGAFVITRALEQVGLSSQDVDIVSLGVSEHEYAFRKGAVDAMVTFEPTRSKLLAMGANVVFDSRKIPGEIVDVLVVPQAVLERRRNTLDVLVQGWFRALDYLNNNPQDGASRIAPRQGVNPEQFLASLQLLHILDVKENQQLLSQADPKLLNTIKKLSTLMMDRNLLRQAVDAGSLLDDRLVKGLS